MSLPQKPRARSSIFASLNSLAQVIVVFVVFCFVVNLLLRGPKSGSFPAHIAASASNMKQITLACVTYAAAHSENLPSNLNDPALDFSDKRVLQDPAIPHSHPGPISPSTIVTPDYLYAGANLNLSLLKYPADTILLYDKHPNKSGQNIAFADGHIEYITDTTDLQSRISATNTARANQHLPPLPPNLLSAPQPATLPSN